MKALLIINPESGTRKALRYRDYILVKLYKKFSEIDYYQSKAVLDIKNYISNLTKDYDSIIVCGGDGTLGEAVNGIMSLKKKPLLGYIPCGTLNDMSKVLHIKKIDKAIAAILAGETGRLDVIKMNNYYSIYGAAVGKFSEISYEISDTMKKMFGKLSYYLAALKLAFRRQTLEMKISYDDKVIEGRFNLLLFLLTPRLGGYKIIKKEKTYLDDASINIKILTKPKFGFSIIQVFTFFLLGDYRKRNTISIKTDKITIVSKRPEAYNADGEFAFKENVVTLEVLSKQIEMYLSSDTKKEYLKGEN